MGVRRQLATARALFARIWPQGLWIGDYEACFGSSDSGRNVARAGCVG